VSVELGPYRLEELIGRGGMGEVHRAWDGRRSRWVALKLIDRRTSGDAGYRRRFRREAQITARLSEPHVIPVHDFGEIDGQLFLDMRWVPSPTLARVLEEDGPMPPRRAVGLLVQVAAALDAAHAQGLVHRDVKPSNVLVSAGDFAYVVDFGIARSRGDGAETGTDPASLVGTLAYMPPERLRGDPVDHRADVYALACLLYESLTGRRPFPGDDTSDLVAAHLHRDPPRPSDHGAPAAFDEVVRRGMSKDPDRRPRSAGALGAAATAALTGSDTTEVAPSPGRGLRDRRVPTLVRPRSTTVRGRPRPRGRRRALRIGLAALLAVLTLTVAVLVVRDYVGDGTAVGLSPVALSVIPERPGIVIVNAGARFVTLFDVRSRRVTARVPIEGRAAGAVADARGRVYVATTDGRYRNAISVIDPRSASVTSTVALAEPPRADPAVDRDGTVLFVPGERSIQVVDLERSALSAPIPRTAASVAAGPGGRRLYLADGRGTAVEVIDTGRGDTVATVLTGGTVRALQLSPDGRTLHVAGDAPSHALTDIDTTTYAPAASVILPGGASALATSPDGALVYLALTTSPPSLAAVNASTRRRGGTYFMEPFTGHVALAVSTDGNQVYIANTDLGTVTIDDVPR